MWTSDLIIGEVNLSTATDEGTIASAEKVLDHYAEMGVNGIWLTPVYERGDGNGYGNMGINTIEPNLTGTGDDYAKGRKVLKEFIDKAHNKNIRVFLDVVFKNVQETSPLVASHPNWFKSAPSEYHGSKEFNWQDPNVREEIADWYVKVIRAIAIQTGCDGFRYDMMPATTKGFDLERRIIEALNASGIYPFIISESVNDRNDCYATETVSIRSALSTEFYRDPINLFLDKYNIVDFIKNGNSDLNASGAYKYYSYSLTNHDLKKQVIKGNKLAMGYQAIFSPFIPIIYLGEEWNNPHVSTNPNDNSLYFNKIDWSALENSSNKAFYESVKQMIAIRRKYKDLFKTDAAPFTSSNIQKVSSNVSGTYMTSYARCADNKAAIVVPNYSDISNIIKLNINVDELGIKGNSFVVKDAFHNTVIAKGNDISNLEILVPAMDQAVLIIEAE